MLRGSDGWRLVFVAGAFVACASNEKSAVPASDPAAGGAAQAPSGVGGPCFVSMVRTLDGKPATEKRCEAGLTCDYADAVPDGAGVCRRP